VGESDFDSIDIGWEINFALSTVGPSAAEDHKTVRSRCIELKIWLGF